MSLRALLEQVQGDEATAARLAGVPVGQFRRALEGLQAAADISRRLEAKLALHQAQGNLGKLATLFLGIDGELTRLAGQANPPASATHQVLLMERLLCDGARSLCGSLSLPDVKQARRFWLALSVQPPDEAPKPASNGHHTVAGGALPPRLEKCRQALEALGGEGQVSDVAATAGLEARNCWQALSELVKRGVAQSGAQRGQYRLVEATDAHAA